MMLGSHDLTISRSYDVCSAHNSRTDGPIRLGFSVIGRAWALVVQEGLGFSDGPSGGSMDGPECPKRSIFSEVWLHGCLGTRLLIPSMMD